jgi:hypothetical protein
MSKYHKKQNRVHSETLTETLQRISAAVQTDGSANVWTHYCAHHGEPVTLFGRTRCSFCGLAPDGSRAAPAITNYARLHEVLDRAFSQASIGKGAARHGQDRPFEEQPMQVISGMLNSHTGLLYQAVKKVQESQRMPCVPAVHELLGAINYLAGAVIYLEDHDNGCPD